MFATASSLPVSGAPSLSTEVYRLMVEQASVGMFVTQEGRFRFVNPHLAQMLGYSCEDMLNGMDPLEMTAPEDRARILEQLRSNIQQPSDKAGDLQCLRKDGSRFSARAWGRQIEIDGRPARLTTLHDISELKASTLAAQRRAALLVQTEELALTGSSEYDIATGAVTQSTGMFRIFGAVPTEGGEVDGEWLMDRVPPGEAPFVRTLLEGVQPDVPCEFEHRIVHADGSLRTVLHRAIAEIDAEGRPTRVIGLLQDITAQRQAEHQRDLLTQSDTVTRLPNRHALLDRLDEAVLQAERSGRSLALLTLEIDHLDIVSDSFGYAAGDWLLAAAAQRLQLAASSQHLLAYLGSGRYAVLMSGPADVDEAQALATALALVATLDAPFLIEDTQITVHGAAGIALCPRDAADAATLLHQAQAAVHLARDQGQRVCVYSARSHGQAAARLAMEAALRRAIDCGEFHLHYQPQMDLTDGSLVGVEALLRWTDPQRGDIPPDQFIPLAEETGLILPIGDWVLRQACEQNLAWQRAGLPPIRMCVNLSVRQLEQPDLARRIHTVLVETGLAPQHLGVEMTESMAVLDGPLVARTLGELRALGIEIALDDFGTGYSNLGTLRSLPIDLVKIDRSLVHDVTAAPQDVSMTRAVINMAHALKLRVLAEGVETEGQLALLIANGCDQMQGFFYSRPVSPETIAELLRERRGLPEHLLQRRLRQRTLLLVDDEDNIVAALKRLLRRDGYHIITANSGPQGLQRLAERAVDVIVSDQRMPGMTGVEFLRRAKELYPDTVRISLSGYTELQSVTDAINEGAIYKFLTKPWDDERLRGHIADAFKQKELLDENRRLGVQVQTANHELAEVNQRLEKLLASQGERIGREEGSLNLANEMLFGIPTPLIGIDPDGMIAFANADAQALFAKGPGLLGLPAHEVLPARLAACCQRDDHEAAQPVDLPGGTWLAATRSLGRGENPRGQLLLLTPLTTRTVP